MLNLSGSFLGRRPFPFHFLLLLALLLASFRVSAQTNIYEYPLYNTNAYNAYPQTLAYAPNNTYWFTEYYAASLANFAPTNFFSGLTPGLPAGAITNQTEYFLSNSPSAYPYGMVADPVNTNYMWFTESISNQIGRINIYTHQIDEYQLPDPNSRPVTIIAGPGKTNLYVVEYVYNRIIGFDPASPTSSTNTNQIATNYVSQTILSNSQIFGLTVGPDDNLWVAVGTWGLIGKLNVAANETNFTSYSLPLVTASPFAIVAGPDNNLWFTEYNSGVIGKMNTNGVLLQEYVVPFPTNYIIANPYDIIVGADSNLWFTEYTGGSVGRITTNGIITIFPTPTTNSFPTFLATGNGTPGADTNIWISEDAINNGGSNNNYLGQLILSQAETVGLQVATQTNFTSPALLTNFTLLASYQTFSPSNTVTFNWGDGTSETLTVTNTSASTPSNTIVIINTVLANTNANALRSGNYVISAAHHYSSFYNYSIGLTITDASNEVFAATIAVTAADPFFNGQVDLTNSIYYLAFSNSIPFGYYSLQYFPYIYHYDLGFEYFFPANDGTRAAYLYDYTTGHYFYTSPSLFPYLYDFTLNAWLYYYPDTTRPLHYTTNPRYFYNFGTSNIITM